jgi:hypothetical protein
VVDQNAERSAGLLHAAGGSPISTMLGSTRYRDTALSVADQGSTDDPTEDPTAASQRLAGSADLSSAVRECRRRVALDDIWQALAPVSRHSDAALLCLELEDVDGLEHHLQRVVDGVRAAGKKFGELKKQRQVSA